jgi:hypothetical protein
MRDIRTVSASLHAEIKITKQKTAPSISGVRVGDYGIVNLANDDLVVRYQTADRRWIVARVSLAELASKIETVVIANAKVIDLLHGKTRAPTLAEAAAHNGRWLVHCADLYSVDVVEITDGRVWCDGFSWPLAEFVAANPGALWRPINADRAIVAWPEVAP